jgi:hypothetical protein
MTASAPAGDVLLALYGRLTADGLRVTGDRRIFDRLVEWEPED